MTYEYLWLIWSIWIVSSLVFIRFYIYLLFHRSKLIAKPTKERFGTPKIIFQVTTKGNIGIVQDTINRINSVCSQIDYKKYEIWTVTDAQETFEGCKTIVVPVDFSCNAIHKGRALQFAVDLREKERKNNNETYIFHLDDESLITKQTLCSLLSYLEDDPKPISEGLIIYPVQEKELIKVSNLMDTLRPFCCYECLEFMNSGKPAYIHGSNLLVRSDIEEKVGWSNGKTLAEDTLFAIKAKNKFGTDIFGWHGGVIEEKSPLNIRDVIKQRKRWFYGLIQNMKFFNRKEKIKQVGRALIWTSGLVSGIASIIYGIISILIIRGVVKNPYPMPFQLFVFLSITSAMWLLSYQVGAFFNGKYLPLKKRISFHILTLLASIPLGIFECLTPVIAIIKKPKSFEVIKK